MSCARAQQVDLAAFRSEPGAAQFADFRDHYPTCADCSREVAAWSRLAAALEDGGAGSAHPSEETLLAFSSDPGGLDASARTSLEAHLAGCARCRSELSVLRSFDFGALAAPAAERDTGPSLLERAGAGLTRLAEAVFGVPQPALALAAILLLALPAAFFSWRAFQGADPGAPEPPIAREEPRAPVAPTPVAEPEAIAEHTPAPEPLVPEPAPEPEPEPVVIAETPPPAPAREEPTPPAPEPIVIAALLPGELPRYQPDLALSGGSFEDVRITSVVRAGGPELPRLRALGPEHTGATSEAQPTLYWDLAAASEVPVEITLVAEDGIEPLLEERLTPPVRAGLHRVSLRDKGIRLAPGTSYLWFVAFVPDPDRREDDVVSGAGIRHTPPSAELRAQLEAAGPGERAHVLARAGYWYDAFDTVSGWLAAEPDAQALRAARAALLEQAGL